MSDEAPETVEGEGEIVPPIMDYTPDPLEQPEPEVVVPTPPENGSLLDGPQYPAPGA